MLNRIAFSLIRTVRCGPNVRFQDLSEIQIRRRYQECERTVVKATTCLTKTITVQDSDLNRKRWNENQLSRENSESEAWWVQ